MPPKQRPVVCTAMRWNMFRAVELTCLGKFFPTKKTSERRGEQSGGCVGLHRICFDAARIAYEGRGKGRYIISKSG